LRVGSNTKIDELRWKLGPVREHHVLETLLKSFQKIAFDTQKGYTMDIWSYLGNLDEKDPFLSLF